MNTNQIRNNAKARGNGHGGSSQDATQKIVPTKPGRESSSSSDRNRAKTGKIKTLKLYASEQTKPTHIRMAVMMCMLERDPILLGLDLM